MVAISKDKDLIRKIRESGVCFVEMDGSVCTSDIHHESVRDVIEYIKASTTHFGGRHFGNEPPIKLVAHEVVQTHLAQLTVQSQNLELSKKDETEVAERLVKLLEQAINEGVSDIHIKLTKSITLFNKRQDGIIAAFAQDQDAEYGETLLSYAFLRKGNLKEYSKTQPADATFNISLSKQGEPERNYAWRLSQMPTSTGAKCTLRNLDSGDGAAPALTTLGLSDGHIKHVVRVINETQGAILISGPTGSGKTTLIVAALATIPETKLIHTLEDPAEWEMTRRNEVQTTVDPTQKIGKGQEGFRDFAYMGKKLLRNDTDVVFMGEIRDHESAKVALRMAETGQICVATLHTNSSISSASTLVEQMGISPSLIGSPGVLKALGHQRLARTLCKKCSLTHQQILAGHYSHSSDIQAVKEVESLIRSKKLSEEKAELVRSTVRYKNFNGCTGCTGGEKGRTALFELVLVDDIAREFIKKKDFGGWEKHLEDIGWPSIRDHGTTKVFKGLVDIRTVIAATDGLIKQDAKASYAEMIEEF